MELVRLSSKPLPLGVSYRPFPIGFTETISELFFGSNLTILRFWTFILDGPTNPDWTSGLDEQYGKTSPIVHPLLQLHGQRSR